MRLAFRGAAVLLALFCAGHTVGTLAGRGPGGDADAVLAAMRAVHFDFKGSDRTYYQIFFGHGLIVSLWLAGSALTAWWLGRSDPQRWRVVAPIAWGLATAQLATAAIAWTCFFVGPALLTSIAALLLVGASFRATRQVPQNV